MAKSMFIEVTDTDGSLNLININSISRVTKSATGIQIQLLSTSSGNAITVHTTASYEDLKKFIAG